MKRLTLKNSSNHYQFKNKRDYISEGSLNFVGKVEDLFEQYGIDGIEGLEQMLSATCKTETVAKADSAVLYDGLTAEEVVESANATEDAVVEEVVERPKRTRKKKEDTVVVEETTDEVVVEEDAMTSLF